MLYPEKYTPKSHMKQMGCSPPSLLLLDVPTGCMPRTPCSCPSVTHGDRRPIHLEQGLRNQCPPVPCLMGVLPHPRSHLSSSAPSAAPHLTTTLCKPSCSPTEPNPVGRSSKTGCQQGGDHTEELLLGIQSNLAAILRAGCTM